MTTEQPISKEAAMKAAYDKLPVATLARQYENTFGMLLWEYPAFFDDLSHSRREELISIASVGKHPTLAADLATWLVKGGSEMSVYNIARLIKPETPRGSFENHLNRMLYAGDRWWEYQIGQLTPTLIPCLTRVEHMQLCRNPNLNPKEYAAITAYFLTHYKNTPEADQLLCEASEKWRDDFDDAYTEVYTIASQQISLWDHVSPELHTIALEKAIDHSPERFVETAERMVGTLKNAPRAVGLCKQYVEIWGDQKKTRTWRERAARCRIELMALVYPCLSDVQQQMFVSEAARAVVDTNNWFVRMSPAQWLRMFRFGCDHVWHNRPPMTLQAVARPKLCAVLEDIYRREWLRTESMAMLYAMRSILDGFSPNEGAAAKWYCHITNQLISKLEEKRES